MDIAFTAAFETLKMAQDLAKVALRAKAHEIAQAKIREVLELLKTAENAALDFKLAYSSVLSEKLALLEQKRECEKKLIQFEKWESEERRYELKHLSPNSFVYKLKESESNGEPLHLLCCYCYEDGKKSILQFGGFKTPDMAILVCHRCKHEVKTDGKGFID